MTYTYTVYLYLLVSIFRSVCTNSINRHIYVISEYIFKNTDPNRGSYNIHI